MNAVHTRLRPRRTVGPLPVADARPVPGIDWMGPALVAVFLVCVWRGPSPRLYITMFLLCKMSYTMPCERPSLTVMASYCCCWAYVAMPGMNHNNRRKAERMYMVAANIGHAVGRFYYLLFNLFQPRKPSTLAREKKSDV